MQNQLDIIKETSILIEEKKFFVAEKVLKDFVESSKNLKLDIKIFYNLYLASDGQKNFKNAKKYLEKCLKINNKNYIVLNNLANVYFREKNFYKAEKLYLQSFEFKNDYLLVIVNLAIFYQNLGRLEESKKFYLKAIEISPKRISIFYNLSRVDNNFIDEEKIKYLKDLIKNEKQELSEISYGYFLLAENERKKKNYKLEIEYLQKANKYSFDSKKKANNQTLNYWKNIITKKYNKFQYIPNDKKNIFENFKPIFIIGLPRSGSTVVEALISSANKNIFTFGEASIFNGIIAKDFSDEKNRIELKSVHNKILKIFENINFDFNNKNFIDKSLENFFYVDVILNIFPQAKFINTVRNIDDNIFAIFKQSLSKISWTHSIDDILEYIDNYFTIINYFIKKNPDKIFTIHLEELTNNPEDISKKLYSFCNLEWSNEVLNFYTRKDLLISTASNIQIRDNIKKYDNKKYKPYKNLLKSFYKNYDWLDLK